MTEEKRKKVAEKLLKTGIITYNGKTYKHRTTTEEEIIVPCCKCVREAVEWDDFCCICVEADKLLKSCTSYFEEIKTK